MRLKTILLLTVIFATSSSAVFAAPISSIISFGDSLSDGGNASIATLGNDPGPGYATRTVPGVPFPVGYYTNPQVGSGPSGLWVDQLAAKLGVADPSPALAGGTNYAIGSAETGNTNPQDMANQVALFLSNNGAVAPSSALYTFWGGANDILNGQSPITAADNIEHEIEAVAAAGGKTFLWLNLPALGGIPELAGNAPGQAAADFFSGEFNAEWALDIATLDNLGIDVVGVNVDGLFNNIQADPAAYGLTNITTACAATLNCNPNHSLYWDEEHPTTYGHKLVTGLAYDDLTGVTPEPSSFILLGTGLLGALAAVRRRLV